MKAEVAQNSSGPMIQIENLDKDVKSLNWLGKNKEKKTLVLGSSLDRNNKDAPVATIVHISSEMLAEMEADVSFAPVFEFLQKGNEDKTPSIRLSQEFKRVAR